MHSRRQWLALASAGLWGHVAWAASHDKPRSAPLVFPRDHGAHPDFQTEWWYITGYASSHATSVDFGFQLTFFRSRVAQAQGLQSSLAARQLLFAHAAITDLQGKKLWHDQRIARWSGAPPGDNAADVARASTETTNVVLRDWSLRREDGVLLAQVRGTGFALDLRFKPTQTVLLQGVQGFSQKGPQAQHASYYYSEPQLAAGGSLTLAGTTHALGPSSRAWLDHEWSHAILPSGAVGWDWIGINFFDGSALTAFQLREPSGQAHWDGGSFRTASTTVNFPRGAVRFTARRHWRSPASQALYPVEWQLETPTQGYLIRALLDNQELDSRRSTGAFYWEGLCELLDERKQVVGRGYLEMTGYAAPLLL